MGHEWQRTCGSRAGSDDQWQRRDHRRVSGGRAICYRGSLPHLLYASPGYESDDCGAMKELPPEMTESREQHSYARLHGRWLLLARGVWITLVILTLTIFFASLPMYLAQLQTPCTEIACEYQNFTHAQA